jgi:hypothetical protein
MPANRSLFSCTTLIGARSYIACFMGNYILEIDSSCRISAIVRIRRAVRFDTVSCRIQARAWNAARPLKRREVGGMEEAVSSIEGYLPELATVLHPPAILFR